MKVDDAPGMLRVRLRDHQKSSGSGNNYPTALVVAAHADRAAFARQALAVKLRELDALAVKLRELDALAVERDRIAALAASCARECRDLAIHCERFDADLDAAINVDLRRFA